MGEKFVFLGVSAPPKILVWGGLCPPPPTGCFYIESPSPIYYWESLVSVFEQGSHESHWSQFYKYFEHKIDYFSKYKLENSFFIGFRRFCILLDQKPNLANFKSGLGGVLCPKLGQDLLTYLTLVGRYLVRFG